MSRPRFSLRFDRKMSYLFPRQSNSLSVALVSYAQMHEMNTEMELFSKIIVRIL